MIRDDPAGRYEPYDFSKPAQLGREHARRLEAGFESFARQWSSQLTAKIRLRSHISLLSVDLLPYAEYADALPSTTSMVQGVSGDDALIVQFGLDAALLWVSQMMGSRTQEMPDARPLTPIELALVTNLLGDTLEHLGQSLGAAIGPDIAFGGIHYSPQFLQIVSTGDAVIVARYTMRLGDVETTASVMLPAASVIARLDETGAESVSEYHPDTMLAQMQQTPLELALRLAPLSIGAGDVLKLAVGDLITLPHPETRPFDLVADDIPVASAIAGSAGSRLACTITTLHEETH